jgi:hypothetical protein
MVDRGMWQIYSSDGKRLMEGEASHNSYVDFSSLPAGIYVFSLESEGKFYRITIIRNP